MGDLESAIKTAAEKSILTSITKGEWISIRYDQKAKLPDTFMEEVWALVDEEKIKTLLADKLEEELVDRVVNHMAAEIATDIKQVLSVKERREAIRHLVRSNIDAITKIGESHG